MKRNQIEIVNVMRMKRNLIKQINPLGNDFNNVPKTISVRTGLAWAVQQKLQTGRAVARSRHTGEWRMSIVIN